MFLHAGDAPRSIETRPFRSAVARPVFSPRPGKGAKFISGTGRLIRTEGISRGFKVSPRRKNKAMMPNTATGSR
jgi:hypothetical protein